MCNVNPLRLFIILKMYLHQVKAQFVNLIRLRMTGILRYLHCASTIARRYHGLE